ncbi:MBL fold metallo-hydrolase [Ktedonosporobacter rubrisoli]|uniref:MBL fold metallo-hydrolase n=2 Tax=Ktedonosporobacter rubrisoli TaxID=2509675 RepID=A0A4P6K6K7_KTERU|nr:MBL fold metallo-hydrolase [Ktedonosporobacter rubrisoli]
MSQATPYPVRITHIGGPTALIEIGSLRFLTDPTFGQAGPQSIVSPTFGAYTLEKKAAPSVQASELGEVHAVLLSHDQHIDNLDLEGRAYLPQAGTVLTTPVGAQRLGGNAQGVPTWETVTLAGADKLRVRVTSTPTRHGPVELAEMMGDVTGWVLEWEGQQRGALYISGDTVLFEELQEIPRRFKIGTALLHLGAAANRRVLGTDSNLTFTAREGALFAKELPAATIIPIHYEGWSHLSEGRAEIESAFTEAGLEKQLRFLPFGQPVLIEA